MPPLRGRVDRPLKRPRTLLADRGYDHDLYRRKLRKRGIKPQIARRGTPHGSGLGAQRWVTERSLARLHGFRRLLVRYERRAEMHEALMALGCCVICFRQLRASL
jgi:transposase